MAPKAGGNAKKEGGRAKKAENEAKKKESDLLEQVSKHNPILHFHLNLIVYFFEQERKEAAKWSDGAKSKASKEEKEEKRKAELARKAENARLLAEEESAAVSKPKVSPKKNKDPKPKPAGPGAIAASAGGDGGDGPGGGGGGGTDEFAREIESYSATGLDNALDLMEVVTAKMDKASVGQQAAGLEKHPERRFKAVYEAYKERELPKLKEDVGYIHILTSVDC